MDIVVQNELLGRYPPGSDEYQYHEALLAILDGIRYDTGDVQLGCALIHFLSRYCFVGAGLDTATHSAAGSTREDALFTSHAFKRTGKSPEWWQMEFLENSGNEGVVQKCHWWKTQFEQSPLVECVL